MLERTVGNTLPAVLRGTAVGPVVQVCNTSLEMLTFRVVSGKGPGQCYFWNHEGAKWSGQQVDSSAWYLCSEKACLLGYIKFFLFNHLEVSFSVYINFLL